MLKNITELLEAVFPLCSCVLFIFWKGWKWM